MKHLNSIISKLFILAMFLGSTTAALGQAVSINSTGAAPDAQSVLDVTSTDKGVLLPRMTTAQRNAINPSSGADFGMMIYNTSTSTYDYWDGSAWQQIPNANGIVTSLDGAYDGGGSGAGRSITVDAGSVQMNGSGGSVALETDGDIQLSEDQWVGLGSTIERVVFDGSLNRIDIEGADVTMDDGRWIGVDGSSPRIEFEDASGRLNMQDADIQIDDTKWIGINASNPRILFEGGTTDRMTLEDADIRIDNNKWFGLGASIERFEFQGSDGEVNLMGAEFGIGTLAPTTELDVNGQIRMRTGATNGYVPVGDANGVMTWTDPATFATVSTASNGLTAVSDDIQLGGTLSQNTTIAQGAFTLDLTTGLTDGFSIDGTTFSVDGSNNRIGIGTDAPSSELDVNGQIRMRTGAAIGYVPVSSSNGTMTWTDPATISTADVTLDEAYDGNGPGLGRTITADNGAVNIEGSAGLLVTGNVGIGTTDQTHTLVVHGTNADAVPVLSLRSGNDNAVFNNGAQIGFGYNATSEYSHFIHTRHNSTGAAGNAMDFYLSDGSTASNSVTSGSVQVMTLAGTGNVGIGVTNPSVKLEVAGDATISGKFNSNGIQESSDARFKKNVSKIENALENVMKLEGVTYNWKVNEFPDRNFTNRTEIGVIAQEIEKIYPELVSTDAEGYKAVQYSHLVPVLIEAIKEQQAEINNLNGTVTDLSTALNTITKQLETLQTQVSGIQTDVESSVIGTEVSTVIK